MESVLHAFPSLLGSGLTPVDEIRPVSVDYGAEGQPVSPGIGEVGHSDSWVFVRRPLGPSQEVVFGRNVGFLPDHDIGYLEHRNIII